MTTHVQVFQLPVLQDNYIYILRDEENKKTATIDPALSDPVQHFLLKKKWNLDYIFNTHHHIDHIGGNLALKKQWNPQITGFAKDSHRIPGIVKHLKENEELKFGSQNFRVLFLPGHTLGHIAYWFYKCKLLFCGDVLFGMGCGRLFEGSAEQMFHSLQKIKALPPETKIYCAHEYTERNGQFALHVDPHNLNLKKRMKQVLAKRNRQEPTVPFLLSEELKTNPFLRAKTVKEFATIRQKKDQF